MSRATWVTLGIGMGAVAAYVATGKVMRLIREHPELREAQGLEAKIAAWSEVLSASRGEWTAVMGEATFPAGREHPHRAAAGQVPGGLKPEDLNDPLYEF